MKRLPFKRQLAILASVALLIGILVPAATFAKSASHEPGRPPQPPKVALQTNSATGASDPVATIKQGCPATAPINPTPFNAGDVVSGTATFTSTDTGESSEPEEANNALSVFITIPPVFVTLNQTTSFTFIATAGDNLFACFVTYDGDEVGTINYTVTPKKQAEQTTDNIVGAAGDIVAASSKICETLKCTAYVKAPLGLLDKFFTIISFGPIFAQEKILGDKLDALHAAIKKFGPHSHQACVAGHAAADADAKLRDSLVALVPGLAFIFPPFAGEDAPCR